jgi:hypothetical protein
VKVPIVTLALFVQQSAQHAAIMTDSSHGKADPPKRRRRNRRVGLATRLPVQKPLAFCTFDRQRRALRILDPERRLRVRPEIRRPLPAPKSARLPMSKRMLQAKSSPSMGEGRVGVRLRQGSAVATSSKSIRDEAFYFRLYFIVFD